MTTDRPRPGRVGGPLGVGIRAGGRIWKRQIPLRLAGPAACACARPRPSLVFLAPAPPSLACRGSLDATGRRRQPACWRPPAGLGWAGLGLRAHIASSQSPVQCSSYRGFAVGLCLRQRTATQRVSRRRPSLSGWREREGEAPYSAHGSRRTPIGIGRAIIIGARTFSVPSLKSL